MLVERVAAQQRRAALAVDDRNDVDAELPDLSRSKAAAEGDSLFRHAARAIEGQRGAAPVALALVPQRHGTRTRLLPVASLAHYPVLFRLHQVREVGSVRELETHVARLVLEVLEHDVLVRALGDEAIAPHGDRDRVVPGRFRLAHDPRRVVVDGTARQRLELLALESQVPA